MKLPMKHTGVLLLLLVTVAIISAAIAGSAVAGAVQKREQKWNISSAGVIPTEFGEITSVGFEGQQTVLVFRNKESELTIVKLVGQKVKPFATRISRKY